MFALAVATALATVNGWYLLRQWNRGKGSSQFVLRALPAASLLLALPVAQGAYLMLGAFQSMAARGSADERMVLSLCARILRTMALGNLAFLIFLGCAVFLQVQARGEPAPEGQAPDADPHGRAGWHARLLVGASLLTVLAALVAVYFRRVVTIVTQAAVAQAPPTRPEELADISSSIATGLNLSISFGGLLSTLLLVAAGLAGVLLVAECGSKRVTMYSWIVAALASAFVVANVAGLASDFFGIVSALH